MKRTRRHQSGHVFRHRRKWYLRYRDDVLTQDGTVERVQHCRSLGDAVGLNGLTRSQAEGLADEFLRPINDGTHTPASTMTLNRFIEHVYLPDVENHCQVSTYRDYKNKWLRYVKPRGELTLRDFKTLQAEQMLRDIASAEDLSATTLRHIKNFLSGVFRYAHRIGILNGANPMREVKIPKARPAGETYAYSLDEIIRMLAVVPEPAATVMATAGFTGVSKGELRGLLLENYDGTTIRVTGAVWRSQVKETKNRHRKGTIPVIAPLARLLDRHIALCGRSSGFIFANAAGKPMNLDTLAANVIRPALAKAGVGWHGWHAFRRGLATNLHRLGAASKSIQQILRHSNISTTMNIYVKSDVDDATAAMKKLEAICATTVQPHIASTVHVM